VAAVVVGRRELRMVADSMVHGQDRAVHLRLRVAARNAARLRYDQFMQLGWKVLLPINLAWILAVAAIRVLNDRGWPAWKSTFVVVVPALLIILAVFTIIDISNNRRQAEQEAADEAEAKLAPAFPIPPLDLRIPESPRRRDRVPAGVTAGRGELLEGENRDG